MSRPPSPTMGKGYFSSPFERFVEVRDDAFDQLSSAFTLLGSFVILFLPECGISSICL